MSKLLIACCLLASPITAWCYGGYPVTRAPASTDSLTGVWGTADTVTTFVSGRVTLDLRQLPGNAQIDGYEVTLEHRAGEVSFSIPGGRGWFHAKLVDANIVNGWWIQPREQPYPYRFASPVRLVQVSKNVWSGLARPLSGRIRLYLKVFRDADGATKAFFRDPQTDWSVGVTYRVDVSGNRVTLVNERNTKDIVTGRLEEKGRKILLFIPRYGTDLLFAPETPDAAVGFYERNAKLGAYRYRVPIAEGDDWKVADARDVGLNEKKLNVLVQHIIDTPIDDSRALAIHAVLIAHHGKLALEEYFAGLDGDVPQDLRSAGKTLTTTLVGVAMDEGDDISPTSRVTNLFPQYRPYRNFDRRKASMTLGDLMSMTSGYYCDDTDPSAPGNETVMMSGDPNGDWTRYIVDLPMAEQPGGKSAVYCSVDMDLVAAAVASVTHTWLPEFFDAKIARPMSFGPYAWNLTPTGRGYGGGGAYLRPRDSLKIGQLFLDNGKWDGKRIISASWVRLATMSHSEFDKGQESLTTGSPGVPTVLHRYGYGWHLFTAQSAIGPLEEYMATGNGGQIIAVIPRLDMVVMFSGGNYNNEAWRALVQEVIPQYVIPAALDR
jgi:CubicO group peptidase (beta-lactamase class C family)